MESQLDDCVFCRISRDGPHLAATEGFVAVADIHPQAPVHVLVMPTRHVPSLREIGRFSADEQRRMLDFIVETAASQGLEDFRVVANVGAGAGQSVFHLHWHLLGDPSGPLGGSL